MPSKQKPTRVVIMGAAGRDFHNFNMVYRDDPDSQVIAFTADQIPDISGRSYPASLAGKHYPEGIPIVDESALESLCREQGIDQVMFAYSDVSHTEVMHKASLALSAGADFMLLGPRHSMLQSRVPVIAVCAVRTGCGKSQTTRWLARRLKQKGLRVAVIRRTRCRRLYHRGTRGVRTSPRGRHHRLRGSRLRQDRCPGAAGNGHHPVGRGQ
jgi:predicted GTPase